MNRISLLLILFISFSCGVDRSKSPLSFNALEIERRDESMDGKSINFEVLREKFLVPFACTKCHSKWTDTEENLFKKLIPGKPFESKLYLKVEDGSMPPKKVNLTVTKADIEILEKYIRNLNVKDQNQDVD